jgi:glycosyltransferase involved in cell wall biosynthesis
MNIWFAADIPGGSYGGVGRSMHELAAGLRSQGHNVTIITRETTGSNNYLTFALKLGLRFILSGRSRPDWLIARSTDAVFCALFIHLLRLKTGTILHNHGWEEKVYEVEKKLPCAVVSTPTMWKSTLIRFPLLRLMLRLCTYCMSGTINEIRYIRDKYPQMRKKLTCVPNGTDIQPDGYWKDRDELPLNILSIGNLTWKKNINYTIKVFSSIKERISGAHLFCIGTGTDDTALQSHINISMEGITNIPSVTFDNMKEWYGKCPFMISSSRYEGGHPLAILEALSSGIVVFASNIASHREIIHDRVNGYLISGSDRESDADSIFNTLTQGTKQNVRMNAVETAKRNRWSRQVTRLERILCRNR